MISAGKILAVILALAFCGSLAGCNDPGRSTEEYPNRLIELIVPWAAGGGTDRVARFIADALQRRLKQPVIVVNRTGGSGAVGHSAGALAPPDGYTLTMATFELSTMRSMSISELTWRDFSPVAQVNADAAAIIVRQDAPWQTLTDLIDAIRKEPGKLKMSGTATGGAWDLARSGLLLAAGIPPNQVIWAPTQGSAPALVELLGGHVDVVCCSAPEAASQLESGQARMLAVLGPQRLKDFPQYPTAREQGIDYDAVGWRGIMLPKNAPAPIVQKLNNTLAEIAKSEQFNTFMAKNGFVIEFKPPAEFASFLEAEENKWRAVIENAGYGTLGRNHDPGPRMLPLALFILLLVAIAGEALLTRRRRLVPAAAAGPTEAVQPFNAAKNNAIFLVVVLVVYLLLLPRIGFVAATVPFALLVMWKLGTRWWIAALSSVAVVGVIHLLFVVLFKVQLP